MFSPEVTKVIYNHVNISLLLVSFSFKFELSCQMSHDSSTLSQFQIPFLKIWLTLITCKFQNMNVACQSMNSLFTQCNNQILLLCNNPISDLSHLIVGEVGEIKSQRMFHLKPLWFRHLHCSVFITNSRVFQHQPKYESGPGVKVSEIT